MRQKHSTFPSISKVFWVGNWAASLEEQFTQFKNKHTFKSYFVLYASAYWCKTICDEKKKVQFPIFQSENEGKWDFQQITDSNSISSSYNVMQWLQKIWNIVHRSNGQLLWCFFMIFLSSRDCVKLFLLVQLCHPIVQSHSFLMSNEEFIQLMCFHCCLCPCFLSYAFYVHF